MDIIEAGFPIASERRCGGRETGGDRNPAAGASRRLARCAPADIERAAIAIRPAGAVAHPHVHRDLRPAPPSASCGSHASQCLTPRGEAPSARRGAPGTDDVQFSAEDATRSDFDFLCRVIEAVIDAGATTINLPDTVGYSTPDGDRAIFSPAS